MLLGDYAARYVAGEPVVSAPRSLRVGMAPGHDVAGWSSARLPIQIPGDVLTATISMEYLPQTANMQGGGRQAIGILDASENYVESIIPMALHNSPTWKHVEYGLQSYIGQWIWIYVGTENVGGNPTRLYADNIQITYCRPPGS
jgi:hypothetical protein